jgi:predicted Zn-dependent protease
MQRILCLLPFLAALATAQEANPGRGVNFYSIEKEVGLGRQLASEFQRNSRPLDSPTIETYINDLGQRLAALSGAPVFRYTFALIADDPTVLHEPAAFPGGFVFVPVRLILTAKDEDELAGMLAHSIAHVAARHGTKQVTRAQISSIPLIYVGGSAGSAIRQGNHLAIPMGLRDLSRKYEIEADGLAVRMMSAAGYDPAGLARYIEREQRADDWSALPSRTERLGAIQAAIAGLAQ